MNNPNPPQHPGQTSKPGMDRPQQGQPLPDARPDERDGRDSAKGYPPGRDERIPARPGEPAEHGHGGRQDPSRTRHDEPTRPGQR